jgi:hypothetical protein
VQLLDPSRAGDAFEREGARFRSAGESVLAIHGDEAEFRPVSLRPLEVVEGGPVKVAADVDAR